MAGYELNRGRACVADEQCGTPLGDDPDDDPPGGPGGSASCGECDRSRNFEADLGALDAADGSIDGMLDW